MERFIINKLTNIIFHIYIDVTATASTTKAITVAHAQCNILYVLHIYLSGGEIKTNNSTHLYIFEQLSKIGEGKMIYFHIDK